MRVEFWKNNCDKEGKCVGGGQCGVKPEIKMGNGCGIPGCHCSDGYWLMISEGFVGEGVRGVTCHFDSKAEFERFIDEGQV